MLEREESPFPSKSGLRPKVLPVGRKAHSGVANHTPILRMRRMCHRNGYTRIDTQHTEELTNGATRGVIKAEKEATEAKHRRNTADPSIENHLIPHLRPTDYLARVFPNVVIHSTVQHYLTVPTLLWFCISVNTNEWRSRGTGDNPSRLLVASVRECFSCCCFAADAVSPSERIANGKTDTWTR